MKTSLSVSLLTGAGLGLAVGLAASLLLMITTGGGSPLYLIILISSALTGLLSVLLVPARSIRRIDEEQLKSALDHLTDITGSLSTEIKSLSARGEEERQVWASQAELLSEDLNRLSIQLAALSAQLASQAGDLPSLAAQAHRLADRGLDLKARSKLLIEEMAPPADALLNLTGKLAENLEEATALLTDKQ